MEIASRKRHISESSVEVDEDDSGSDFATSTVTPPAKRQRTTKASSTNIETSPSSKPADVFARGARGKIWQSKEGHPIGSDKWKREVFARDEVWAHIQKLPKTILNSRLSININAALNPVNNVEKPAPQPRRTPGSNNGPSRKTDALKASSAVIDLSERDNEPEIDIEEDAKEDKSNLLIPESVRLAQQQIMNHGAASHSLVAAQETIEAALREDASDHENDATQPSTPASIGAEATTKEDANDEKEVEDISKEIVVVDNEEDATESIEVVKDEEESGSGAAGVTPKSPKKGNWEPEHF